MKKTLLICCILGLSVWSCKDDDPELGAAPAPTDANFTFTPSSATDNIINFTATANGIAVWDFGNGSKATGRSVSAVYPLKGDYDVTLSMFTQGGNVSNTQTVSIADNDFTLLEDSMYYWLTGGIDNTNGKTWVIDSNTVGHFGVTFSATSEFGKKPKDYVANPNDAAGVGMYDDRYTFKLIGFTYEMYTKGEIYVHSDHQANFSNTRGNAPGQHISAQYPNQLNENWNLKFDEGSDSTITFSSGSWLGMNTDVLEYQIIALSENQLRVRYLHRGNPNLAWYLTLIPEGYVPPAGGGGSTGTPLPYDFETVNPGFIGFNGSTARIIDNPAGFGLNFSAKVLETIHGGNTDSGITADIDSKLDFSADSLIKFKIFAPVAGTIRVKLESQDNSSIFVERDVNIPVANTWLELTANFSGENNNTYDKIVLFPGWNTTPPTSQRTYYLDDIKQAQ